MKLAFWIASILLITGFSTGLVAGEDMTDRIVYPEYWYQQGVSEFLLKHYDRALSLLNTAVEQDPELADAWYWRGVVLSVLGDPTGSEESIAKAKAMNPMIDDPYHRRVGPLAEISVTPVPTPRTIREDETPQMVQTNIDLSKQPDPTGPDMIISSFTPNVREGNSQLEVKATVVNQGYRPTTDFFITFYASDDADVTKDDTAIGYYLVPNLKQGKEKNLTGYFPMDQMTPGTYYLGAIADPANEVMEVSETNNAKSFASKVTIPDVKRSSFLVTTGTVPFVSEEDEKDSRFADKNPDLVVNKITSPQTAAPGGTLPVNTTIKNEGSALAGPFRLSLYISPDALITEEDRELGYGDVKDLGEGMLREGTAVITIPGDLKPGVYYLGALVDSLKAIPEENEANNVLFADKMVTITAPVTAVAVPVPEASPVQSLPDLTVLDLSSDPEGVSGGVMNVTTSIRNTGTGNAGQFIVQLYLSSDTMLSDEDILLGMGEVPELPAGTQSDGNAPSPIPQNMTPGLYYFGIVVDDENKVTESDESNNVGFAKDPVSIR